MSMSTTTKLVAQCWRTSCELWIKPKANPPPPPPPPPHTHTHTNCSNCHTTFRDIGETRWNLLTAFSEHMGNPCRKSPGLPFWSRFAFYENYCYDALKLLLWRDKIFNRIIWHWQYFLLLVFVSSFVSFCVYSFWNILVKLEQILQHFRHCWDLSFVFSIIILAVNPDQGLGLLKSPNLHFAAPLCGEM